MPAKKEQYRIVVFDTYFMDVRRERIASYTNDDEAINAATLSMFLLHPQDTVEIQIYRKGLACGEWCMFAVAYYEDGLIVVDDCYC